MATPYDFMTNREAGGNSYANGATTKANPYALPQNAGQNQQGMIRQPTQATQTTNPQTGSSNNQTFSLYGGNQPTADPNQSTRPTATTRPGIPGTSYTRDAQGNPVYANGQQGDWNTWNAARRYGTQYGAYGTPGAYAQPQGQQQQAQQTNGGNIGGTYPQQSNPYGVSTSMGGGAQPQTGGYKGAAPQQAAQTGAPGRNLQTQQYGSAPSQGTSAQPTNQPNTEWQPSPGATMPTTAQTQTQPGQNGWQAGPGATMPQMGQQGQGGNGQTSPNPDPYGQPWVDYMNADGSPHINYQYGQSGGGGAQGPTGPNPGSDTYWQNPNAILGNNRDPRLPQNDRGPMQYPQQQGAQQQGSNGLPFTWDQYSQARNDNPRIAQEWAQLNLPYAQLQQNTNQYNQDFTEAQRRYDQQFLQSQGQQAYDQMMQTRQQHMAEQQYQTGIDQWDRQFAQTQGNDRFNQDMASQDFTRQGLQWNQQFGQQTLNDNRNFALQQTGMNQQYGLDIRGMNLQEQNQSQQYGLSQNAQAMQQQQMLHSMGIDTRGMTLQEQTQAANQAFQQQQLGQQATLSREQMASQERMATLAATGRQQAPTTKWVRSW